MNNETMLRKYPGSPDASYRRFNKAAKRLSREGWTPVSERYEHGSWGIFAFLIALLLCLILIGILVFIYMIIVKPTGKGTLYVTYERTVEIDEDEDEDELKTCPECAESVKEAARICRYCRYEFE